jgi:hypothetical protein
MKVHHCGCNCPPLMKRDQTRQRTTRVLRNLTHLPCIESQCLHSNANIHCTMAHKVMSHLGNLTARRFDSISVETGNTSVHISTCGDECGQHGLPVPFATRRSCLHRRSAFVSRAHIAPAATRHYHLKIKRSVQRCLPIIVNKIHVGIGCDETDTPNHLSLIAQYRTNVSISPLLERASKSTPQSSIFTIA